MIEIIAEIGVNHGGDFKTACALVDEAAAAGCDVVKTQLWSSERVYPPSRWQEMKGLELTRQEVRSLKAVCACRGVEFLCTPDDIEDARFLVSLDVERIKIGSASITDLLFLEQVACLATPIILSTGAATLQDIDLAVRVIKSRDIPLSLLHCVSAYPAPMDDANLLAIPYLHEEFGVAVGLSDHFDGPDAALVALALGARVFEKHLTLDRNAAGPDHKASVEPDEMKDYVARLRRAERALGDGRKRIMPSEEKNREAYLRFVAREGIHADGIAAW